MITVDELVMAARSWIGTPYLHQGRNRFGVDCIGFPIAVLRELDLLPKGFQDYRSYGRTPSGQMEPIVERYATRVALPRPGSLLLIRWPKTKQASHAAIITGRTMLHSYQRAGGVVEHGFRGPWVKFAHTSWLLPGVSYE